MTIQIACHQCNASNRLPSERLQDKPKCGKCGTALLPGTPIELSANNFAPVTSKSDLPVIVDFWAAWCGPCKMMAPAFERAAAEFATRAVLAKLNTEDEPAISERFNVRSIPTLIVFKGGHEVTRQAGALDVASLTRFIQGQIA
ncbi:MAG: thioredoxin TrxC [Proteobacteria bacterium]|nr:thioredoxin TrxC [Pseudomonadota bacterium]